MRASDGDRDRVADQLREALAEGRLSADEHAERLDAVYQAKTYAELAPLVEDLPATGGMPRPAAAPVRDDLPAPRSGSPNIVAILSGAERKGRWLVEAQTNALAVMGGVDLDLREAVLSQREVTINVVAVLGGVEITVPPGVQVINSVVAILGGCEMPPEEIPAPDAPVIRLTGFAILGGIEVKRREVGDRRRGLRRGHHMEIRDMHREIHEQHRELRRELRDRRRQSRRNRNPEY